MSLVAQKFVVLAASCLAGACMQAAGQVPLVKVAMSGERAPDMPPGVVYFPQQFSWYASINNAGDIAFHGLVAGPGINSGNDDALWVGPTGGQHILAREGDPAPGAPDGAVFWFVDRLFLTSSGEAVIFAMFRSSPNADPVGGIWRGVAGHLVPIALVGDPAPGYGAPFNSIEVYQNMAVNTGGVVVFSGSVAGPNGALSNLWVGRANDLHPILPMGGGSTSFAPASINDAGDVALFAHTGFPQPSYGVAWRFHQGTLVEVARGGEHFGGMDPDVRFVSLLFPRTLPLDRPAIDSTGRIGFPGWISGPGIDGSNQHGFWVGTHESLGLLLQQGDPVPGTGLIVLGNTGENMLLNAGGTAVLHPLVGPSDTFDVATFVGVPGQVVPLAFPGMQAPGASPGVVFRSAVGVAINNSDEVVIAGTLTGPGVTAANDKGYWVGDTASLRLVVREGDQVQVAPGDSRTVAAMWGQTSPGPSSGQPLIFNDRGQLVLSITFTDGSSGVFLANTGGCAADWNNSGSVNSSDFFDFLHAFFMMSPGADFNVDGVIDSRDFFDFLGAYFAGC